MREELLVGLATGCKRVDAQPEVCVALVMDGGYSQFEVMLWSRWFPFYFCLMCQDFVFDKHWYPQLGQPNYQRATSSVSDTVGPHRQKGDQGDKKWEGNTIEKSWGWMGGIANNLLLTHL